MRREEWEWREMDGQEGKEGERKGDGGERKGEQNSEEKYRDKERWDGEGQRDKRQRRMEDERINTTFHTLHYSDNRRLNYYMG